MREWRAGEGREKEGSTDAQTDGPGRQLAWPNEFPFPALRQVSE